VLTARVILNIREAASRRLDDVSFDLHLSDLEVPGSRISFAENPAVFHFDGGRESDIPPHRERFGSVGTTRTGMVSVSNSTVASHITLPMTKDAKGKRVVRRPGPEDSEDEDGYDKSSIQTSHDEWV